MLVFIYVKQVGKKIWPTFILKSNYMNELIVQKVDKSSLYSVMMFHHIDEYKKAISTNIKVSGLNTNTTM